MEVSSTFSKSGLHCVRRAQTDNETSKLTRFLSRHMDRHNRPYKCTHKGCERLRGFTYAGGLSRHEREVHKMHGGTKTSLFCPHADCKRSSGSGFTRKENLADHIRRMHRTSSGSTDTVVAEPHDFDLGRVHGGPEAAFIGPHVAAIPPVDGQPSSHPIQTAVELILKRNINSRMPLPSHLGGTSGGNS